MCYCGHNYTMQYIHMCYCGIKKLLQFRSVITISVSTYVLHVSCMWIKDVFHYEFNSGQLSGLPTELPTHSILDSSGLPTELPTELPTISVYGSSGQPNLHSKIPMGSPLRCPLSCPLFPYMEVVGSLICMVKFQWAAHGQPTPLSTCIPWAAKWAAPLFFSVWVQLSHRQFLRIEWWCS